jgi:NitT/TauT family transport system ATP-binding protein
MTSIDAAHPDTAQPAVLPPGPAAGRPLIELAGVSKRFATRAGDPVTALEDLNLAVGEAEFVSVVGPSGCGKTTLLRIVAGLETPTSGRVTVAGEPVTGPRPNIAMVFQQATLLPWYPVLENVLMPVRLMRRPTTADRTRAAALLEVAGLSGFAQKFPFELSGGMQQRVAICRALVRDPTILLMDEPFGALDAMTRETMNIELMRLWAEHRKTVVFITHSIPEAVLLSDRVAVMSPRPSRISRILEVPIPRPRSLRTMAGAGFAALCDDVRSLIGAARGPGKGLTS